MTEYMKFEPGEKFGKKGADISPTLEGLDDAGYVLEDRDLVIDIDCLSHEAIQEMIKVFNISTEYRLTERGVHLYYKKPARLVRANSICAFGIKIEYKTKQNTKAITVKRNGVERPVFNQGIREDLPEIFIPKKTYLDLLGMDEGDGRNNALFQTRQNINDLSNKDTIIRFINQWVFADPLNEKEIETLTRMMAKPVAQEGGEYEIASYLMKEYRMVKYQNSVYFYHEDEFITNNEILKRIVFDTVGNQKMRYVEEVMKQIDARCKLIDDNKVFDIKFTNGILRDGKFIEIEYKDFTPYSIDVPYIENATPVKDVVDYVNHLTNNDESYRTLLFEILGHTLIVDKEVKRMLAKFFIFIGGGGNGKGTLLQIIKAILNEKNVSANSIDDLTKEQYLVSMKGKLANLGDDIQDTPINEKMMKMLKNISTSDFIQVRELYQSSTSIALTTSLIFASNHRMKSFEKGESYKRRVMWLPMYSKVKEGRKDPQFITKQTSPEALIYWVSEMVSGYMRLYENGAFTYCKLVDEENTSYHAENNELLVFLGDMEREDFIDRRWADIYRDEYVIWAEENGANVQSEKAFKNSVMEMFNLKIDVRKVNNKSQRVFVEADADEGESEGEST